MRFFPMETLEWRALEPTALRRLSISLVAMALIAGVVLRLVRLASLHATGLTVLLAWIVGLAMLATFVTLHLGNFPLRQWVWRAPAFALIQSVASLTTSAVFVAIGMERIGSASMGWAQWRMDILPTLVRNSVAVCAYALMLAAGVQMVRRMLTARRAG
ncbi:MAG TPA: hypothetical protein VK922_05190 [Gemmatimonadaceae bacterium]|nr:hypothetical protein [Gemmatimonadaceae bacterium]